VETLFQPQAVQVHLWVVLEEQVAAVVIQAQEVV
jgi:hypothetical protein